MRDRRRNARFSGPARPFTGLAVAYAIGVLVWQGLRFTPVGEWWPFELLDIFGVWLYAPLPPLLLGGLLARRRAALLSLVLPIALFGWEYGGLFVPRATASTPADGAPLRVMTANLLVSNGDVGAIAATVIEQAPDVVALQ